MKTIADHLMYEGKVVQSYMEFSHQIVCLLIYPQPRNMMFLPSG